MQHPLDMVYDVCAYKLNLWKNGPTRGRFS